jgi:hypothetical protein
MQYEHDACQGMVLNYVSSLEETKVSLNQEKWQGFSFMHRSWVVFKEVPTIVI